MTNHHVAWADRLGLPKIWFEDAKICSENFNSEYYPVVVERFENDIINIKDGPNLWDMIQEYKKNKLDPMMESIKDEWVNTHPMIAQNSSYIRDQESLWNRKRAKLLHHFIIQLLDDEGFGFYKSNIEEDHME